MPEKKTIEASKRMDILIQKVGEEKPIGGRGAVLLNFTGVADGKEIKCGTFKKSLFDAIKKNVGLTIGAEVEISQHEYEGNTYTDYRVNQVYIEGKPVDSKENRGGWRSGDSPEKIASIEAQTAFNGVCLLLSTAKVFVPDDLIKAAYDWARARLPSQAIKGGITQKQPEAPRTTPQPATPAPTTTTEKPKVILDMNWLKESLEQLQWADVKGWLKEHYKVDISGKFSSVLAQLTEDQQWDFAREVEDRLKMA